MIATTQRVLVFTDVVNSTRLVEHMGEVHAAEVWMDHDRRARELLARHRGREIDRTDGFFLLFDSVDDAAGFAVAYHEALKDLAFSARAGIHLGPVVLYANAPEDIERGAKRIEIEGVAKPFAARIMSLAQGGQTLMSAQAREAWGDGVPGTMRVASHGHYRLKGIEDPVEIFELAAGGAPEFLPPPDAEKAYRVAQVADLWVPLREVPNNLPAERDAFVGRRHELRELADGFASGVRLVSIVGTGGCGKTRVAIRYARTWLGDWPGGVWFADLSEVRSLDGLCFAVASALGIPLGKGDAREQLVLALASRGRCLVILDNCEQIVAQVAAMLEAWLGRPGEAAFLATTRERLQVGGEHILSLEPLPLDQDAIDLFVTRVAHVAPALRIGPDDRLTIASIVRLLDGLPLAIELAAARTRVLSLAQILDRMRDRFQLVGGARDKDARQGTLRNAIDWSWNLLAPWEQSALAQCTVFEGGVTLAAAEAVIDLSGHADAPPVMDVIQALVDKSLVRALPRTGLAPPWGDAPRFGMYLSIRDFAKEKLATASTHAVVQAESRHGAYFAGFGSDLAIERLFEHGGIGLRGALALELDNLMVAFDRAIARNDPTVAVDTYRAAWEVLELKGPFSVGVAMGDAMAQLDPPTPSLRLEGGTIRAIALLRAGRLDEARTQFHESLTLARELGAKGRQARIHARVGSLEGEAGNIDAGRMHLDAALAIARDEGDRRTEGTALGTLANLCMDRGRLAEARAHLTSALAIHRACGNRRDEGVALSNLGAVHQEEGSLDVARSHYESAIEIHREVGNKRFEGMVLGNLGLLHLHQGRIAEARELQERALANHRELGNRRDEGASFITIASIFTLEGRLDESLDYLARALEIAREVRNRLNECMAVANMAGVYLAQRRLDDALQHYEEALVIARAVGSTLDEGSILTGLGLVYTALGDPDEALKRFRQGEVLLREAGDRLDLALLLCAQGHADVAIGDREAARAAWDEARRLADELDVGTDSELGRSIAELESALG